MAATIAIQGFAQAGVLIGLSALMNASRPRDEVQTINALASKKNERFGWMDSKSAPTSGKKVTNPLQNGNPLQRLRQLASKAPRVQDPKTMPIVEPKIPAPGSIKLADPAPAVPKAAPVPVPVAAAPAAAKPVASQAPKTDGKGLSPFGLFPLHRPPKLPGPPKAYDPKTAI
mmetsp:Transcript_21257/g.36546  ORF Transcript_21257/g.36546 Transcript_21257/m.36546 type:complete len:172 (-) Transcript_21257:683-1198(-)